MPATFAEDVAACAEAGCPAMEVWLTKLEQHLETQSIAETKSLLAEKKLLLVAAAYQGGLLLSQGEARKAHLEHFRKRLELCQGFGIGTMLLVADFRQTSTRAAGPTCARMWSAPSATLSAASKRTC